TDVWLGWAAEVTQGTPVVAANTFDALYSGTQADAAVGRTPIEVRNGSANSTIAFYDKQGRLTVNISQELGPVRAFAWLAANGVTTGGIIKPGPITITENYGALDAKQYPGCKATKHTIRGGYNNTFTIDTQMIGTAPPVTIASAAAPAFTAEDPFDWSHWQKPTVIGATAMMECEDVELVIDFTLAEFYGGGQSFPTRNDRSKNAISGRMTMLYAPAEYAAYKAKTYAPLVLSLSGYSHTAVFTIPKAVYLTYPITSGQDKYVTGPVTFGAVSRDASDMMSLATT
ncbi:MAG: phage tail tube protein, partial [Gammaproteobacteria bacterium]